MQLTLMSLLKKGACNYLLVLFFQITRVFHQFFDRGIVSELGALINKGIVTDLRTLFVEVLYEKQ